MGITGKDVEVAFSEWLLYTAGWTYFTAGSFQTNISASQVPPDAPVQLNTTSFCVIAPGLCTKYPNMLMALHIEAMEAPEIVFNANGIDASALGSIDVFVVNGASQEIAFTLVVNVGAAGAVHLLTFLGDRRWDRAVQRRDDHRQDVDGKPELHRAVQLRRQCGRGRADCRCELRRH